MTNMIRRRDVRTIIIEFYGNIKRIRYVGEWLVKKGVFGRKRQVKFYVGKCDIDKETDYIGFDEALKEIQHKYKTIRVWLNRSGPRIGEFLPRCRILMRIIRETNDPTVLNIMYDSKYSYNNKELVRLVERNLSIIHEENMCKWLYILQTFSDVDFGSFYKLIDRKPYGENVFNEKDCVNLIEFDKRDLLRGDEQLEKMGLQGPFVCFAARDSKYLKEQDPKIDFSYHNYRNASVENYSEMIDYLGEKGIKCVRIGKDSEIAYEPFNCIDYSAKFRNEYMDIYLPYKSMFCVVGCSGIMDIPLSVNGNVVIVNVVPLFCDGWAGIPQTRNMIIIFKKYYLKKERRFLTLAEYAEVEHKYAMDAHKLDSMGITCVENTPDEIMNTAKEMYERLTGTWKDTCENDELQNSVKKLMDDYISKYDILQGQVCHARVGYYFLKKNRELLGL